jgi:uncharacterized membrane protein YhaH (DUF805 family)
MNETTDQIRKEIATDEFSGQPSTQPPERSVFLPLGRIGRATYAARLGIVWAALVFLGMAQRQMGSSDFNTLAPYVTYLLVAFMVVTSIKRLHDMGYSSWAVIILGGLVPLLLFLPGTKGPNAYGVAPSALIRKRK